MLIIESNLTDYGLYSDNLYDGIVFECIGYLNDNKVIEQYYKNFPKFKQLQNQFIQDYIMGQQNLGLFGSANHYSVTPEENSFNLLTLSELFTIYNPSLNLYFLKKGLKKVCEYCIKNKLSSILIYLEKRPEIINGAGFTFFDKLSEDYPQLEITIRLF